MDPKAFLTIGLVLGITVFSGMTVVGVGMMTVTLSTREGGRAIVAVGVAVIPGTLPGMKGLLAGVGVGERGIMICLRVRLRGPFGNPVVMCQLETGEDKALSKAPVSALDFNNEATRVPKTTKKIIIKG